MLFTKLSKSVVLIVVLEIGFSSSLVRGAESCLTIATKILGSDGLSNNPERHELVSAVISASKRAGSIGLRGAEESDLLAQAARTDIVSRSTRYSELLKNAPQDSKLRQFDHVIIGGGPEGAIAANNLKGSVLVINETKEMGTFAKFGDTFFINSEEIPGVASPNILPGAKGQMVQVADIAKKSFPPGRVIGNATEINLSLSHADFYIGDRAASLVELADGRFEVQMANGEKFSGKNILNFTGMGQRKFPFSDQATKDLVAREYASGAPRIRFIDDMMTDNQKLALAGENPLERTAAEDVVVIGKGDGGAITIEHLLGKGPDAGYAFADKAAIAKTRPRKVYWIGQDARTPRLYKKATWERYWDLAPEIGRKAIEPVKGRVSRIEEILSGPDQGKFKVWFGKGPKDFRVAREVIVSAGYDQSAPSKLAAGLNKTGRAEAMKLEMVPGTPPEIGREVNIAKQVTVDGVRKNVYVGGPATGGLQTVGEAGGENSPRIQTLGTRTAELARKLSAGMDSTPKCFGCSDVKAFAIEMKPVESPVHASFKMSGPGVRFASEEERQMRVEFRMLHALNSISEKSGKTFDLKIVPGKEPGIFDFSSKTLDAKSLETIQASLKADPELVSLLSSPNAAKEARAVSVECSLSHASSELPKVEFGDPAGPAPTAGAKSGSNELMKASEVSAGPASGSSAASAPVVAPPVSFDQQLVRLASGSPSIEAQSDAVRTIASYGGDVPELIQANMKGLSRTQRTKVGSVLRDVTKRIRAIRADFPELANVARQDEGVIISDIDRLRAHGISDEKIKAKLKDSSVECPIH